MLTLGQTLAAAGPTGVRLSDEFVPGELIVTLDPKAARLGAGPPAAAAAFEASFGMQALGGAADREMLFRLPAAGSRANGDASRRSAPRPRATRMPRATRASRPRSARSSTRSSR